MILVDAQRIAASRPGKPLFTDLSLTVASGDRLGVVGLNGCGKSTLLRALAGRGEPESGQVHWGRGTHQVMLDQNDDLPAGTVGSVVGHHWEAAAVLDRLGMTPFVDRDVATLSGGQRKRTALARALVAVENRDSDLLLLDEPTNHLDVDAIEWLEKRLARFTGGLVMVTHDRHVLDRVTTKVLELDRGRGYLHVAGSATAGSGYQAYLEARALREEQAVTNEQVRRNLARTELAWLRRGAPARTSKPKARIDAALALLQAGPEAAVRSNALDLGQLGTQRLGSKVVELHGVGHRWDPDGPWLFRHLDLILEPGDRIGVVGANGAGKSTLLDILDGRVRPAEGRMEVGSTVNIGYSDQLNTALDPSVRVRDAVAGPHREPDYRDAALLRRFWFDDDAQFAPIGLLSGGERRRLQLLMVLASQPNVLLLDEPTNDLDLDTLRALEDFLEEYAGAMVVVSHDRAFLERTVEHVIAIEEGRAALVPGGYQGWLDRRAGSAARPSRPPSVPSSSPASAAAGPKRRSPSTLSRLLRDAERDLQRATAKRDKLTIELSEMAADAGHEQLAKAGTQLAEAEAQVMLAEERWLDIASEAEAG